ncbi:MAG: Crp/Fnr family transcriptional regulator [Bacteroidota bacterium]
MYETLSISPVFTGMTSGEIKDIFSTINFQIKNFYAGQIIALSEDRCESLLFVVEGSVKGEMIDYSGKIIKIEDIEAPRPIAPAFLFGKNNKYPVNVVANDNVKILFIPKNSFVKLMQSSAVILYNYLDAISNRTQFLSNKIKFLSFKTIKGKIAHYILQLSKGEKEIITIPKTQQEMADFFGVTRPSFGRSIGEMEKEGLIDARGKEIRIIDRKRMMLLLQ